MDRCSRAQARPATSARSSAGLPDSTPASRRVTRAPAAAIRSSDEVTGYLQAGCLVLQGGQESRNGQALLSPGFVGGGR